MAPLVQLQRNARAVSAWTASVAMWRVWAHAKHVARSKKAADRMACVGRFWRIRIQTMNARTKALRPVDKPGHVMAQARVSFMRRGRRVARVFVKERWSRGKSAMAWDNASRAPRESIAHLMRVQPALARTRVRIRMIALVVMSVRLEFANLWVRWEHRAPWRTNVDRALVSTAFVAIRRVPALVKPAPWRKRAKEPMEPAVRSKPARIPTMNAQDKLRRRVVKPAFAMERMLARNTWQARNALLDLATAAIKSMRRNATAWVYALRARPPHACPGTYVTEPNAPRAAKRITNAPWGTNAIP